MKGGATECCEPSTSAAIRGQDDPELLPASHIARLASSDVNELESPRWRTERSAGALKMRRRTNDGEPGLPQHSIALRRDTKVGETLRRLRKYSAHGITYGRWGATADCRTCIETRCASRPSETLAT